MNIEILKVLYEYNCLSCREISHKISITYRVMVSKIKELEQGGFISFKEVYLYSNGFRKTKVFFLTKKGEKIITEILG